jgi:hypothetical protein
MGVLRYASVPRLFQIGASSRKPKPNCEQEASSRHIDFEDNELPVITVVLKYLYTQDYDDTVSPDQVFNAANDQSPLIRDESGEEAGSLRSPTPTETATSYSLVFNTEIYIAVEKFDIPALKELATQKYESRVSVHWNSPEYSEAAELLWENTVDNDRLLRNVVIEVSNEHIDDLLDCGEFVKLMGSQGSFCLEVLRVSRGRKLDGLKRLKKKNKKEGARVASHWFDE